MKRLFFALWPHAVAYPALRALVQTLVPAGSARPQRPDQWHVTLQFLGSVADERFADVLEAGDAASARVAGGAPDVAPMSAPRFSLRLDRVEHWPRPRVLCLTATEIPPAVAALVAALREELARRGFDPETREFRPHLTLARHVAEARRLPAVDPVRLEASEFTLVESVATRQGSRYRNAAHWAPAGRLAEK